MAKLADIIAAAHERNFTDEQFSNLKAEKNAKRVFDILKNGWAYNGRV